MKFYYVLQSKSTPGKYYAGITDDLGSRLNAHNEGKCMHTSKFILWQIKTAIAFTDREKTRNFEKYLKTSSGCIRQKTIIKNCS